MLIAVEGTAGSGKTTLRDRVLALASDTRIPILHLGQFSWLSAPAARTLVALRTGRSRVPEDIALAAAIQDVTMHAGHNLLPGLQHHHVIGDRMILSTACLLADHYPRPVEEYVTILANAAPARPTVTVLVETTAEVCAARLAARPSAPRPGDRIDAIMRHSALYRRAADAWQYHTGQQVWALPLHQRADTEQAARRLIAELESQCPA